jgi:dolichyl-phosphate-mannose--protein O-mannosyl transferase
LPPDNVLIELIEVTAACFSQLIALEFFFTIFSVSLEVLIETTQKQGFLPSLLAGGPSLKLSLHLEPRKHRVLGAG